MTGASSGLGRAFAEMLLQEGLVVSATSRDGQRLPEGIKPLALDLAQPQSVRDVTEAMQGEAPDILINNAGYALFEQFAHLPPEECENITRVLLTGPQELCRAFYPAMCKRGRGIIVNVSSIAAVLPLPYMSIYSAAKAGLSQFSRGLMLENQCRGVAIVDLQLGDFATGFNTAMTSRRNPPEALQGPWQRFEKYLQEGPPPEVAAQRLRKILLAPKSGVYTAGSFFQTKVAPLFARLAPVSMQHFALRRYYHCSRRDLSRSQTR